MFEARRLQSSEVGFVMLKFSYLIDWFKKELGFLGRIFKRRVANEDAA